MLFSTLILLTYNFRYFDVAAVARRRRHHCTILRCIWCKRQQIRKIVRESNKTIGIETPLTPHILAALYVLWRLAQRRRKNAIKKNLGANYSNHGIRSRHCFAQHLLIAFPYIGVLCCALLRHKLFDSMSVNPKQIIPQVVCY